MSGSQSTLCQEDLNRSRCDSLTGQWAVQGIGRNVQSVQEMREMRVKYLDPGKARRCIALFEADEQPTYHARHLRFLNPEASSCLFVIAIKA